MAFFSDRQLVPKRKFNWVVEMSSDFTETFKVAAKTVAKPNYTLEATQHKFLNHQFNFPNRVIWQPIDITLIDHIGHGTDQTSVTSKLMQMLFRAGYQIPRNAKNCEFSPTKTRAVNSLKKVQIHQLSGDVARPFGVDDDQLGPISNQQLQLGTHKLETWTLHNAFISKVTFGDLSYDDDGLVELSCTFTYDFATYAPEI